MVFPFHPLHQRFFQVVEEKSWVVANFHFIECPRDVAENGVIHNFDLSKASVHDIHYLKDVKEFNRDCVLLGDRGYLSAECQLTCSSRPALLLRCPCDETSTVTVRSSDCFADAENELKRYSRNFATSS